VSVRKLIAFLHFVYCIFYTHVSVNEVTEMTFKFSKLSVDDDKMCMVVVVVVLPRSTVRAYFCLIDSITSRHKSVLHSTKCPAVKRRLVETKIMIQVFFYIPAATTTRTSS